MPTQRGIPAGCFNHPGFLDSQKRKSKTVFLFHPRVVNDTGGGPGSGLTGAVDALRYTGPCGRGFWEPLNDIRDGLPGVGLSVAVSHAAAARLWDSGGRLDSPVRGPGVGRRGR